MAIVPDVDVYFKLFKFIFNRGCITKSHYEEELGEAEERQND